jgi:hypothetical protein
MNLRHDAILEGTPREQRETAFAAWRLIAFRNASSAIEIERIAAFRKALELAPRRPLGEIGRQGRLESSAFHELEGCCREKSWLDTETHQGCRDTRRRRLLGARGHPNPSDRATRKHSHQEYGSSDEPSHVERGWAGLCHVSTVLEGRRPGRLTAYELSGNEGAGAPSRESRRLLGESLEQRAAQIA